MEENYSDLRDEILVQRRVDARHSRAGDNCSVASVTVALLAQWRRRRLFACLHDM